MIVFRTLAHLLSPAGGGAKMSVLIFHRVRASPDPFLRNHDLRDLQLGTHELESAASRRKTIWQLVSRIKYMPATQRAEVVAAINERSPSCSPAIS